jgi:hypothetical protein
MGSKSTGSNNPNPHLQRRKKHSRRSRKKKSFLYNVVKWAKKNPVKAIAIFFGILLIYITILFIQYANKNKRKERTALRMEWNYNAAGSITISGCI